MNFSKMLLAIGINRANAVQNEVAQLRQDLAKRDFDQRRREHAKKSNELLHGSNRPVEQIPNPWKAREERARKRSEEAGDIIVFGILESIKNGCCFVRLPNDHMITAHPAGVDIHSLHVGDVVEVGMSTYDLKRGSIISCGKLDRASWEKTCLRGKRPVLTVASKTPPQKAHEYSKNGFCIHCGWEREFLQKTGRTCTGPSNNEATGVPKPSTNS